MQPGCPWSDLSRAYPPNVKWCEEQLCSWVVEPANTWSNMGYILVGLGLLVLGLRQQRRLVQWFGWAEIVVGVTSFVYHMAWNFLFQVFDFFGMYVFVALLLCLNLVRMGVLPRARLWPVYWAAVVGLTLITPVMARVGAPIQLIVLSMVLGILGTEWAMRGQGKLGLFWLSLGLLASAFAFSASDVSRFWCHPENHVFQGHAIWHVLGSLSLWASCFHYEQFVGVLQSEQPRPATAQAA
jgi:hypothetical protein